MIVWDNDTISVISSVAEVVIGLFAGVFAIWAHRSIKRSEDENARTKLDSRAAERAAERIESKVNDYFAMMEHPDSRSLEVLSELQLEDLVSDENIRLVIDRIEKLSRTDPWEGKSAMVEDVNLVMFFTYVSNHDVDLAVTDLSSVVRQVRSLGGVRHPIQLYTRRKAQRKYATAVSLVCLLLPFVHYGVWQLRPPPLAIDPVDADSTTPLAPHGEGTTKPFTGEGDPSMGSEPAEAHMDSGSVEELTPEQQQWIGLVNDEVTRTRGVMRAMNDTITYGAYSHAIYTLRGARSRLADLQARSLRDSPRELLDVIVDLDAQIKATVHACQEEFVIDRERKKTFGQDRNEEIPQCG